MSLTVLAPLDKVLTFAYKTPDGLTATESPCIQKRTLQNLFLMKSGQLTE